MKQQVHERFENMRAILKQDERAILDSLELDLRQTKSRLDQVQKKWKQHQDQVDKSISSTQSALSGSSTAEEDEKVRITLLAVNVLKTFCFNQRFSFLSPPSFSLTS